MDHSVDTNVLLRAIDQTHETHQDATAALSTLLGLGETLFVTPQNIIEFWNVCTRPLQWSGAIAH
jgi:predicted nucleic acid-binding protein